MVHITDTLLFDEARICEDGALVADVRAARVGIQAYLPSEVDAPEGFARDTVRVYRPEDEVFKTDSMASFSAAPVTIDHPSGPVTADNWKKLGVGEINGDVVRDGGFVRVPIIVRDAAAVETVRTTHKQLSMGYSCRLDWTPGKTSDGQEYDAIQRDIKINHIAAVRAARGGPELKISDERQPHHDRKDGTMPMHTLMIDGLQVTEVSDGAKAAIEKLQGQLKDEKAAKEQALADVAKLTTDKSTLEAEKTTLDQQLKAAKLTPQQLRDAAKAYQHTVDKAKALGVAVADDMDEPAIMKATVAAKLGDAAKDWDDKQVAVSFATLTADVKADDNKVVSLTPAIHTEDKVAALYDQMVEDMKAAAKPAAVA